MKVWIPGHGGSPIVRETRGQDLIHAVQLVQRDARRLGLTCARIELSQEEEYWMKAACTAMSPVRVHEPGATICGVPVVVSTEEWREAGDVIAARNKRTDQLILAALNDVKGGDRRMAKAKPSKKMGKQKKGC